MKLICYLLSFYVLLLSTVPCCSDANCDTSVKQNNNNCTATAKANANACSACSPFYSCCSGVAFTFSTAIIDFNKIVFVKEHLTIFYKSYPLTYFTAKIWQPPKLNYCS